MDDVGERATSNNRLAGFVRNHQKFFEVLMFVLHGPCLERLGGNVVGSTFTKYDNTTHLWRQANAVCLATDVYGRRPRYHNIAIVLKQSRVKVSLIVETLIA